LSAGAQPDAERLVLERDAFAARLAKVQLASELGKLEARLAAPLLRRELGRQVGIDENLASIGTQGRAGMADLGARAARGELLQHLEQLRFARRLQPLRMQVVAQELFACDLLLREMPRGARQALLPLRELLLEQRADAAADEVARQRLVGVALVLDPLEL